MQQAVCVQRKKIRKKKRKKSAPPKTHHEIHSSPATASNSRRHARKHVPRVSPYSPAFIDPGCVEIGLVQLSQSVKTTNIRHALTDTQTNEIMAPCTHRGMKRLFCLKAKTASVASLPRPCLIMKRLFFLLAKNGLGRFAPSALPYYDFFFAKNCLCRFATSALPHCKQHGPSKEETGLLVQARFLT